MKSPWQECFMAVWLVFQWSYPTTGLPLSVSRFKELCFLQAYSEALHDIDTYTSTHKPRHLLSCLCTSVRDTHTSVSLWEPGDWDMKSVCVRACVCVCVLAPGLFNNQSRGACAGRKSLAENTGVLDYQRALLWTLNTRHRGGGGARLRECECVCVCVCVCETAARILSARRISWISIDKQAAGNLLLGSCCGV